MAQSKVFYLIRHSIPISTAANSDTGLNEAGKAAASDLANILAKETDKIDLLLSSRYLRAMETAEAISRPFGGIQVTPEPRLGDDGKQVLTLIQELRERADQTIVLVTHSDIVEVVLQHFSPEFKHDPITKPDAFSITLTGEKTQIVDLWKQPVRS